MLGNVILLVEETGEIVSSNEYKTEVEIAEAICKAISDAAQVSHESDCAILIKATWPNQKMSRYRVRVELV